MYISKVLSFMQYPIYWYYKRAILLKFEIYCYRAYIGQ